MNSDIYSAKQQDKNQDPKWFPWVGGIILGIAGAFVLYLWATI